MPHDWTLIYIGPAGYSGSTLLDVALAQSPEAVSLGEAFQLELFHREGWRCTCERPVPECPFWAPLLAGRDMTALAVPSRVGGADNLPFGTPAEATERAEAQWSLMDAAAEAAGARFVIDSSKHLYRLKALAKARPGRVRFLHLLRDGAEFCRSAGVAKARPAANGDETTVANPYWRAALKWGAANAAAALWARAAGMPRRVVRYEWLAAEPEAELRGVCDWLGLEFVEGMTRPTTEGLHNIAGSRWRFSRAPVEIAYRPNAAVGRMERAASAVMTGAVARL